MKKNRGITMVALVITIVVLLIIAGISIGAGNNAIKNSKLENLKTNMLLIEVKAKEQIENAKFRLGTSFDKATEEEKTNRVNTAKNEFTGEEIVDGNIFDNNTIYMCHTYVYFCDAMEEQVETEMTESEKALDYHLSWASPEEIIKANSRFCDKEWIARDTRIVELIQEMC